MLSSSDSEGGALHRTVMKERGLRIEIGLAILLEICSKHGCPAQRCRQKLFFVQTRMLGFYWKPPSIFSKFCDSYGCMFRYGMVCMGTLTPNFLTVSSCCAKSMRTSRSRSNRIGSKSGTSSLTTVRSRTPQAPPMPSGMSTTPTTCACPSTPLACALLFFQTTFNP